MGSTWHGVPVDQVVAELVRLNRGATPRSFEECCEVASALNWRILILPPCENPVAHINEKQHIIYIPPVDDRDLFRMALHEISELITGKEGGEPEFHFAGQDEEHHNVAEMLVDHINAQLVSERESLQKQISLAERSVVKSRGILDRMSAELQAFTLAASEGCDVYGMPLPDSAALMKVAGQLRVHQHRLNVLQARLRCI
jgi:hypothetical protein